ncbi:hypothetical protein C0Q70_18928 [Pomacea canaliculata]|uniref:Uncharacterized protein n=1 Tax=Pomacea canaliculata TaxID=400727 RepID=A0A2T7NHV9_POMCA|nr:hypothetical protein C0Q70_18928 [Pomacea canaliculata]
MPAAEGGACVGENSTVWCSWWSDRKRDFLNVAEQENHQRAKKGPCVHQRHHLSIHLCITISVFKPLRCFILSLLPSSQPNPCPCLKLATAWDATNFFTRLSSRPVDTLAAQHYFQADRPAGQAAEVEKASPEGGGGVVGGRWDEREGSVKKEVRGCEREEGVSEVNEEREDKRDQKRQTIPSRFFLIPRSVLLQRVHSAHASSLTELLEPYWALRRPIIPREQPQGSRRVDWLQRPRLHTMRSFGPRHVHREFFLFNQLSLLHHHHCHHHHHHHQHHRRHRHDDDDHHHRRCRRRRRRRMKSAGVATHLWRAPPTPEPAPPRVAPSTMWNREKAELSTGANRW